MDKKMDGKLRELILYLVFGVLTTALNWAVYALLSITLGLSQYGIDTAQYKLIANISNVSAWIAGVLFAYFTNKKWVFQSKATVKTGAWREFWLFVSARLASFLLFDLLLFNLCLSTLQNFSLVLTRDQWIKLMMNVLVVIFNYVASKWVIFKKKQGSDTNNIPDSKK